LGTLLLEREQYIRAVISYRQIVRQYPEDAGARYNLGLALWGQGRRDAAVQALEEARRLYERQDNEAEADRANDLLETWGVN
ncbi:MAG: tetratricopeptide repeat protein, partial [Cyanobacteria bacterium J06642_11]